MRIINLILATVIALGFLPAETQAATLLNPAPASSPDFTMFPGWQRVIAQFPRDMATERDLKTETECPARGDCEIARWNAFLSATAKLPKDRQIDAVNKWVNAHPYVEDMDNWGLPDYWETPQEFLTRGGDCEDFAITKYFSLVRLGFSPDDLRIAVVDDTKVGMFHAVLEVKVNATQIVLLDNQTQFVLPKETQNQYRPIYSLNEKGWWMASQTQMASSIEYRRKILLVTPGS